MPQSSPLLFVIEIAGAAALLIWAVRLVRTGVERGWSVQLRGWLRRSGENRLLAAASGTVAAIFLQSSTAVAILTANFVAAGTLAGAAGVAVLLGGDLGSAIVARILLTRADWLVPLLLALGVVIFQRSTRREWRMTGRVMIGLALIFVALGMIRTATEPLRDAQATVAFLNYLGSDAMTAFALGAVFAWAVQSSVAAVLLFVTLASTSMLPATAGVALVLGANLGGSLIGLMLTLGTDIAARRVVLANTLVRGGGAVLMLVLLDRVAPDLSVLGDSAARQIINLHLLFNLALLVVALPLAGPLLALASRILSDQPAQASLARVSALDPAALAAPERALACAAREVLQMGEAVETMLRSIQPLYARWDESLADAILAKEEDVDRIHLETKLYLAQLQRADHDESVDQRALDLAEMAVNLENAGNAISQNMLQLARRLDEEGLAFSASGQTEIADFHDRVLANAQAALNVLMTLNPDAARALVEEKDRVRDIEQALQRSHLERLRDGGSETIATSNIHQETLRALKQVNTAFTQVAYPILSETGDLLSSRLSRSQSKR